MKHLPFILSNNLINFDNGNIYIKSINMEITINNKSIKLKKTFRSVIAYESAMNKPFNPTTVTDSIMYLYCVIISSDESIEITFDEFMDWLDNTPTALNEFTQWLIKQSEIESKLTKKKTVRTKKKA